MDSAAAAAAAAANSTGVDWSAIQWRHPLLAVVLACVCILTVAGNVLVVIAVCTKKYLRNPTGYLIISLAIADLIVGLVVMPLNSLFEMTNHTWILGLTMCDLFHALDILASTSSIWNLCVISLDRYMAGQDPIGYRDKVSKRRITVAIGFVWVMSACLSFPAIAWWRNSSPHLYIDQTRCEFTDSATYVGFSSLVSFYIPLCLILFAYGKVFLIATRHSRSLKSGIKKVKCKNAKKCESESMLSEDSAPTLRIHFGKPARSTSTRSLRRSRNNGSATTQLLLKQVDNEYTDMDMSCRSLIDGTVPPLITSPLLSPCERLDTPPPPGAGKANLLHPDQANTHGALRLEKKITRDDHSGTSETSTSRKKLNVREKSRQMMKYVHEQRAARTLSIVVGAFILSWTPFFVFSPLFALCDQCVASQETMFTIFTWAGHLNSMLNPLIYSRFSRDFRRAFKQILTCQRDRRVKTAIQSPLSLVFTQLISITQFWEPPQPAE